MDKILNPKCYFSFCGCNAKWLVHSDEDLATVCGHHLSMLIDALPNGASVISIEEMRKRDAQGEDPRLLQAARMIVDYDGDCPAGYSAWHVHNRNCPTTLNSSMNPDEPDTVIDYDACSMATKVQCTIDYLNSRRDMPTCRECGCTDDHACDGGCSWVEPNLCSACAEVEK
ncbi:MAG: hypothetical protein ABFD54_11325 [Armatimonadota bacterium]